MLKVWAIALQERDDRENVILSARRSTVSYFAYNSVGEVGETGRGTW